MSLDFANESLTPSTPVCRTIRTYVDLIEEGATALLDFTIETSAGGPVANTEIDSMTLTYVDEDTGVVINTRQDQDVLGAGKIGANDVTVSVTADVSWQLQALDSVVVDPTKTKNIEYHRAIFTITTTIAAVTTIAIREYRLPVRPTFQPLIAS